jgi:hypothetical protein
MKLLNKLVLLILLLVIMELPHSGANDRLT